MPTKRPAPTRAELVLMALDGKAPCCECGDPCVPDNQMGEYLCKDCYKEWMGVEVLSGEEDW